MATLSRDRFRAYSQAIDAAVALAVDGLRDELAPLVAAFVMSEDPTERSMWRDLMTNVVFSRCHTGRSKAQAEAAALFDAISEEHGWGVEATDADTFDFDAVEARIRSAASHLFGDGADEDAFYGGVDEFVKRHVNGAANDCMTSNVERAAEMTGKDIRWASVPNSPWACTICAQQASRGFVFRKNHDRGWHDHCRCRSIAGPHDATGVVEGYDPSDWLDYYYALSEIDATEYSLREAKDKGYSSPAELKRGLKAELALARVLQQAELQRPPRGKRRVASMALKRSGDTGRIEYQKPIEEFNEAQNVRDLAVHAALADYGIDAVVLGETAIGDGHANIDLDIGGKLFEIKSPNQLSPIVKKEDPLGYVYDNLKDARRQFNNSIDERNDGFRRFIFNGVYCVQDDDMIADRITREMKYLGIDVVLQLRKDGSFTLHTLG